jgi:hypothetical protein
VRWTLLALLAVPAVAAGTADAPEVADPAGDVAAFGAPVPQGLGWADIQAAWFERQGGSFALSIRVGDGAGEPPSGEVGVTFRAGAHHYIAGYTVVPGLYSGGFLSRADEDGDVPSNVTPSSMPATFEDGLVVVRFSPGDLEGGAGVASFASPWGWSESRATNGETWRLDRTDVGRDFAWAIEGLPASQEPSGAAGSRDSPAPAWLAAAAVALAALCIGPNGFMGPGRRRGR